MPMLAENVNVNGLNYRLDSTKKTACLIKGKYLGDTTIPGTITYEGITYQVTSIEYDALLRADVTSVIVSEGVTKIGNYAFKGCTNLKNVSLPNTLKSLGVEAFHSCSSLTSIILPNSLETIEMGLFANCENLSSITIPNSITHIKGAAF